MSYGILLRALDGSNPLAFLAALGTLRLVHLSKPEAGVRMCWERSAGPWRPRVDGLDEDEDGLVELLMKAPWAPVEGFEEIGKNITVPGERFRPFVTEAHGAATRQDRRAFATRVSSSASTQSGPWPMPTATTIQISLSRSARRRRSGCCR